MLLLLAMKHSAAPPLGAAARAAARAKLCSLASEVVKFTNNYKYYNTDFSKVKYYLEKKYSRSL